VWTWLFPYHPPNQPIAVIDATDNTHSIGARERPRIIPEKW
jgi:hypothetical protein